MADGPAPTPAPTREQVREHRYALLVEWEPSASIGEHAAVMRRMEHAKAQLWQSLIDLSVTQPDVRLLDADRLALFGGSAGTPDREAQRRADVAESVYQRHADGWHAVMHEIIEPPCWNRTDPDDTEPLTADQIAWMRGSPLPPAEGTPEPTETPDAG